ncbi:MAG TPA: serine/threonine-protein kinase [Planctomycetaceae bacterium]|nr:serine/threonine-protein kinase [Planctomycetaceae bacterium]
MKFTYSADARPIDGYTIRRGIHRGGFGEVYYAVSDAGKEVALKLLTHDLDTELRGVRQCLNLKHPNLVTTFDVRTDAEGDHWVIMEYINGASLEDVLRSFPRGLPEAEVTAWMKGLLDGVEFLHDRGIVHRDLKPANVYRENGHVKIGDVGLSKQMGGGRRGQHTEAVGTVYYMAPEVAKGQYGPEVDVYSLAVMLYEMVTGRLPFDGETTAEILMKHLSARPDLSLLPVKLRLVISRALEKDPTKRTPSVAAFRRELQGVPGGEVLPETAFVNVLPVSQSGPRAEGDTARTAKDTHRARRDSWKKENANSAAGQSQSSSRATWWIVGIVLFVLFTKSARGNDAPSPAWIVAFGIGMIISLRYLFDTGEPKKRLLTPAAGPRDITWTRAEAWAASTLTAAVAAAVLTVAGWYLTSSLVNGASVDGPNVVYSALVSMIASVALVSARIYIGAKRWSTGKAVVLGALMGAVAHGLYEFLQITIAGTRGQSHDIGPIDLWVQGRPTLAAFLSYFSLMMLTQSWSSTLDLRRDARLVLGPVLWAAGYGWVSHFVLGFPVVESVVWAGAINAAAQIATPWQSANDTSARLAA